METITACYSFDWLRNVKIEGKKIYLGTQKVCEIIFKCARGTNFTWVTEAGIAAIGGQHLRTVERNIKKAIAAGIIARGFNEELQKKGFYILPHVELVAFMVKKGIKFVISKIRSLVTEAGQTDSADHEIEGEIELSFSGNLPDKLPVVLYKGVKNNNPPLPPEREVPNQEPCMVESGMQREGFSSGEQEQDTEHNEQENEQHQPVFTAVVTELEQKQSFIPLVALLKSCVVQEEGNRVRIEADKYCLKFIQKHFSMLEEAFKQHGITNFSLSALSDEQQQRQEEKLLAKERQEKARKLKQERMAAEQAAEAERKNVAGLPLEKQFGLLVQTYPQAANGYRDMRPWDYRPAWKVFETLHKTGKIPSVFDLLQAVKQQKKSTDWSRDNGRWIPGLWKWLSERS